MREWLSEIETRLEHDVENELQSNEYRKGEEDPYLGDDDFAQTSADTFKLMTTSRACEVIWNALERRCDPNARRSSEIVFEEGRLAALKERTSGGGAAADADNAKTMRAFCLERELGEAKPLADMLSPPSLHIADMGFDLIAAVTEIRSGEVPQDTPAKRRAKAREIEQAVERLRESLAPLWTGTQTRHFRRDALVEEFGLECIDRWLHDLKTYHRVALDPESAAIAYSASRAVMRRPMNFLSALVADAKEWADEKTELAKPNDPNAARLLFIRRLTAYFRETFGEPLRSCVLAAAGCFFDCSTLDESAIAKLAP